ncbi:hypothetical protein D3C81_1300250 [compost metagenome]
MADNCGGWMTLTLTPPLANPGMFNGMVATAAFWLLANWIKASTSWNTCRLVLSADETAPVCSCSNCPRTIDVLPAAAFKPVRPLTATLVVGPAA